MFSSSSDDDDDTTDDDVVKRRCIMFVTTIDASLLQGSKSAMTQKSITTSNASHDSAQLLLKLEYSMMTLDSDLLSWWQNMVCK